MQIEVTEQEAQLLVAVLAAQPFKDVYQLVFKIDQQIKAAQAALPTWPTQSPMPMPPSAE